MRTIYRSGSHSYVSRNEIVLYRVIIIIKLQVTICRFFFPYIIVLKAIIATVRCLGAIGHSKDAFQVLFQNTHIRKTHVHSVLLYAGIGVSLGGSPLLGDLFHKTTHSRKRGLKSDITEAVVACFIVTFKNPARR